MVGATQARAFLELVRPVNCLMAAFGVALGYWLSAGGVFVPTDLLLAMAAGFLVCAGGMAANDFFDREIDARKDKTKPVPSKRVKPKTVLAFAWVLFLAGIALAMALPAVSFTIVVVAVFALYYYSAKLKPYKFLGNFVIAALTGGVFLLGASLTENYALAGMLALAAFLANVGREQTKDLQDLRADRGEKKTLPMIAGEKTAKWVAGFFFAAAMVAFLLPASYGFIAKTHFMVLALVADVVFVYVLKELAENRFRQAQVAAKGGMLVGLLAFASSLI